MQSKRFNINIEKNYNYISGDKLTVKKGGEISDEKAAKNRLQEIYRELQVFVDANKMKLNKEDETIQSLLKEYTDTTGNDYFIYRAQVINDIEYLQKAGFTGIDKNREFSRLLAQFREITGRDYFSNQEIRVSQIKRELEKFVDAGYTTPLIPGTNNTVIQPPEGNKSEDFQTLLTEYYNITNESYFARKDMTLKEIEYELRGWEHAGYNQSFYKFGDFQKLLQMYISNTGRDYFSDKSIEERRLKEIRISSIRGLLAREKALKNEFHGSVYPAYYQALLDEHKDLTGKKYTDLIPLIPVVVPPPSNSVFMKDKDERLKFLYNSIPDLLVNSVTNKYDEQYDNENIYPLINEFKEIIGINYTSPAFLESNTKRLLELRKQLVHAIKVKGLGPDSKDPEFQKNLKEYENITKENFFEEPIGVGAGFSKAHDIIKEYRVFTAQHKTDGRFSSLNEEFAKVTKRNLFPYTSLKKEKIKSVKNEIVRYQNIGFHYNQPNDTFQNLLKEYKNISGNDYFDFSDLYPSDEKNKAFRLQELTDEIEELLDFYDSEYIYESEWLQQLFKEYKDISSRDYINTSKVERVNNRLKYLSFLGFTHRNENPPEYKKLLKEYKDITGKSYFQRLEEIDARLSSIAENYSSPEIRNLIKEYSDIVGVDYWRESEKPKLPLLPEEKKKELTERIKNLNNSRLPREIYEEIEELEGSDLPYKSEMILCISLIGGLAGFILDNLVNEVIKDNINKEFSKDINLRELYYNNKLKYYFKKLINSIAFTDFKYMVAIDTDTLSKKFKFMSMNGLNAYTNLIGGIIRIGLAYGFPSSNIEIPPLEWNMFTPLMSEDLIYPYTEIPELVEWNKKPLLFVNTRGRILSKYHFMPDFNLSAPFAGRPRSITNSIDKGLCYKEFLGLPFRDFIKFEDRDAIAEKRGTDPHYSMYIRNDTRSIDWDIAYRCANLKDKTSKEPHVRKWRRHTEVSEAYKIDMSAWVSTINNIISFVRSVDAVYKSEILIKFTEKLLKESLLEDINMLKYGNKTGTINIKDNIYNSPPSMFNRTKMFFYEMNTFAKKYRSDIISKLDTSHTAFNLPTLQKYYSDKIFNVIVVYAVHTFEKLKRDYPLPHDDYIHYRDINMYTLFTNIFWNFYCFNQNILESDSLYLNKLLITDDSDNIRIDKYVGDFCDRYFMTYMTMALETDLVFPDSDKYKYEYGLTYQAKQYIKSPCSYLDQNIRYISGFYLYPFKYADYKDEILNKNHRIRCEEVGIYYTENPPLIYPQYKHNELYNELYNIGELIKIKARIFDFSNDELNISLPENQLEKLRLPDFYIQKYETRTKEEDAKLEKVITDIKYLIEETDLTAESNNETMDKLLTDYKYLTGEDYSFPALPPSSPPPEYIMTKEEEAILNAKRKAIQEYNISKKEAFKKKEQINKT